MRKSDIETRYIRGEYVPALNVKVHASVTWQELANDSDHPDTRFGAAWVDANLTDDEINDWHGFACQAGFEQAERDAEEIFGSSVKCWQAGRSGGWLVVQGLPPVESWDAVMVGKWSKFARYVKETVAGVPYQTADLVYFNRFEPWASEVDKMMTAHG